MDDNECTTKMLIYKINPSKYYKISLIIWSILDEYSVRGFFLMQPSRNQ